MNNFLFTFLDCFGVLFFVLVGFFLCFFDAEEFFFREQRYVELCHIKSEV